MTTPSAAFLVDAISDCQEPSAADVLEARRARLAFDVALDEARQDAGILSSAQFRCSVKAWALACRRAGVDPFAVLGGGL